MFGITRLGLVAATAACLMAAGAGTASAAETLCLGPGKQVATPDEDGACKKGSTSTTLATSKDVTHDIAVASQGLHSEILREGGIRASQIEGLNAEIAGLKAGIGDLNEEIAGLKAENAKLSARVAQLAS